MENIKLELSEHEIDIIMTALENSMGDCEIYESIEYEEVLYKIQKELDEGYEIEVE